MSKRPKPKLIHTTTYTRGTVEFEVRVVSDEGSFWGEWTCKACGGTGATSVAEKEIKWAVWSAKTNLGGHYGTTHADDARAHGGSSSDDDDAPEADKKAS